MSEIPPARLLYADTEISADQLYLGCVAVPDAFLSLIWKDRSYAVVNALEFTRMRRESAFDEVLAQEEWADKAKQAFGVERTEPVHLVRMLAREFGFDTVEIPQEFPAGLAIALQEAGVKVKPVKGMFFPERALKTDEEAYAITEGNACSVAGFQIVEQMLAEAEIRDGLLHLDGERLTSERLKEAIANACFKRNAIPLHTIVAGGDQGCDPHHEGAGPIRAHELIIVDIFPRVQHTGYFGDMTRTYLKGQASEAQRKLVATVKEAHQRAIEGVRPGVDGMSLWSATQEYFETQGYPTEKRDGVNVGFFHGLGHGLGLQIHEPPRVSRAHEILQPGHVVTIEPGLYYPGLGGCRIEDVVRVTDTGYELLSEHPYEWEIA